jgi:putative long chain acyl-CoA synthase
VAHTTAAATELAFSLARTAADAIVAANKSARTLAIETYRTLPRLARLGQINDHTRISLGRIMSEQAREVPQGECLLFDGRVHTFEAVDRRINNVVRGLIEVGVRQGAHVGVLMETRPSALVAIAALSRLGAVAVLMPPDVDLTTAARLGAVSEIIADPSNLEAARRLDRRVLVLGGGESRDLHLPEHADVIDMEKIDPDVVDLPGWYRPNPGARPRPGIVAFSYIGGDLVGPPDHELPLGAVRVRHRIGRQPRPGRHRLLPHPAASSVRVAGEPSVVPCRGSRIALSRDLRPERFLQEIPSVRRHGGVLHLGDAA